MHEYLFFSRRDIHGYKVHSKYVKKFLWVFYTWRVFVSNKVHIGDLATKLNCQSSINTLSPHPYLQCRGPKWTKSHYIIPQHKLLTKWTFSNILFQMIYEYNLEHWPGTMTSCIACFKLMLPFPFRICFWLWSILKNFNLNRTFLTLLTFFQLQCIINFIHHITHCWSKNFHL
jgi:hypothetical protein